MSWTFPTPDEILPTAGRARTSSDSPTRLRCPLCDMSYEMSDGKYLPDLGGRVCAYCFKDAGKTPCRDCHLVHGGEC